MRKKRLKLFNVLVYFGAFALSQHLAASNPHASNLNDFATLIQAYENSLFEHAPETALFLDRKDIPQDKFTDNSFEAMYRWQSQEDYYLSALNELDPNKLLGTPEYTTYWLMKETLQNNKNSRICKDELWDINSAAGWHNNVVDIATKQPVGTPENRAMALKRWATFPQLVHNEIRNLKTGISLGFTASKPAVQRVVKQIHLMISEQAEESPFYDFAKRDNDAAFKKQVANLVTTKINPALQEYVVFLENEYLPVAREEVGVSALPPSAQLCYQAKIKQFTTINISPEAIHQLGLMQMERLNKEVSEIGYKLYGIRDMTEIFHRAQQESAHYFSTEKDILDYNMVALNKIKEQVPLWFDLMPKSEGIVKPYPLHRAKTGASGEYQAPSEDGSEPGIFYINTYQPEKISRIDQQATLFHELIPGHHFQIALHVENKSLLFMNRYFHNSGFVEGWALYAERLADAMGVYDDDISRLGMLSNESFRISRLVVDTGIHSKHWTRQQAVDYLSTHSAVNASIIEGEIDRYIAWPGQATAYMLGKLEIERLRDLAKVELGSAFNIKEFHNQVLQNGTVTLNILREQIMNWLSTVKNSQSVSGQLTESIKWLENGSQG
ncbi:DUF885 domain-containing protein [Legionella longbeachae]|uniref:Putative secreted protein n=1 Tax=Legionella longbeachae serogroup 1 (strain NSW150) TaxID=661367 RepID=D3HQ43_LEGLN|nr:DUF885 domain-containing protein [Legionella longbeachae]VEE01527.1 secreted protein [Legionella oakridgensis]HBD7396289.1 DUF885 domain-containing protein [Legionella pneumophila]ARB92119.1 DUF885 domain-containing protein [Legionella longbeachae]ARM34702.1 DUF885 domain-containing protein [Legionella longbeachae]EEZ95888.1 conserved hypothetical protein [Legionella longbeachae D-4968]